MKNVNNVDVPAWVCIEADVLVSNALTSTEKVLYALISALSNNEKKKCFATNKYLGSVLDIKERNVQYCLKKLRDLKLIEFQFKNNRRFITTTVNSFIDYRQKKVHSSERNPIIDYDWLNDNSI